MAKTSRTDWILWSGVVTLAVVGVITLFGDSIRLLLETNPPAAAALAAPSDPTGR